MTIIDEPFDPVAEELPDDPLLVDTLVDACEQYLGSLGIANWGRAFDVVSNDTRRKAAEWLAKQIWAVNDYVDLDEWEAE